MRYRIDLCYDGSPFCGWQIQPNAPSVQQTLEKALSVLLREEISVVGAGRTDTGVNASYYVAHFDSEAPVPDCPQLRYKLNAILPASIAVFGVERAADSFHARFDAKKRTYEYFLHRSKDPFAGRYSYFYGYPELDFEAMNRAAQSLLGTHDFACFEKTGADSKTSVCTVTEAFWAPAGQVRNESAECSRWVFRISADRFLRNMVRAIVGTLLEVGRGKRSPESVAAMLDSGLDRTAAGESVPGHALFLSGIEY